MSFVYMLLEGGITAILARQYQPEFKYRWGIENAFFSSFYRVATLGSGAGVAAIIYLNERRVEYSKAFGLYMLQYAFHKISIAIFSVIFFLMNWGYMSSHFGDYMGLLMLGYAVTIVITAGLILFCCSTRFHALIFRLIEVFNKKGKFNEVERQLRQQCDEMEDASRYLLKKKKMVALIIGMNLLKFCFWYGIPYLSFAGSGTITAGETMAITALSIMLAAIIPAPAGIGSTEFVFTLLFGGIVGTGLAGSASLLYRFATFVFPFIIGLFVVIGRRIRQKRAAANL